MRDSYGTSTDENGSIQNDNKSSTSLVFVCKYAYKGKRESFFLRCGCDETAISCCNFIGRLEALCSEGDHGMRLPQCLFSKSSVNTFVSAKSLLVRTTHSGFHHSVTVGNRPSVARASPRMLTRCEYPAYRKRPTMVIAKVGMTSVNTRMG